MECLDENLQIRVEVRLFLQCRPEFQFNDCRFLLWTI